MSIEFRKFSFADLTVVGMASTKRKSARGAESHVSNKRPKTGSAVSGKNKSGSDGKVVSIEQLAWKEVSLPDRLEDAEGFFGLEEIEDVEVVRDPQGSTVVYKVRSWLQGLFVLHY